ncbi:hypothetical protein JCM8097_006630 [Rhodosporidiobolus ruineniae]
MVSATTLFVTYVVGGFTFIPLCIAAFLGFLYYTSPVVHVPRKTGIAVNDKSEDDAEPVAVYRAGWITVRRTYEPLTNQNDGTTLGMLASGYRSFLDNRSRDPRRTKPKDRFFGVLKQNILFLYEGEDQAECWAAIEVSAHNVVIFPEDNVDGELFAKRTAILLKPKKAEGEPTTPAGEAKSDEATYDLETGKALPWYIFAKVNSDKEDWYHSIITASRLASSTSVADLAADRALFDPEDMARLVESIDAQPDSIPMRWFNALLGRIFLATYRTSTLENYLTSRLVRKLKRVKLPSLLSEVQVREVNVGSSLPLFSRPMLKDLTTDGDASMEVHVGFVGAVRVTIETVATLSLGSRSYSVRLVLAVVLRELDGTLLVKMKKPPSNRLWFGFTQMPKMRIDVEPVVSTRQIKWSLVTGPIESRIRELIAESVVLPHMDDLSFFNTLPFPLSRGGIYGPFLRRERDLNEPAGPSSTSTPSSSSTAATPTPAASSENVAEKPPGGAEEELVGGEAAPSADSTSTGTDSATSLRKRPSAATMRRRRSSEGDRPADLSLTPSSTRSGEKDKGEKAASVKSSSSVSSGLAGLSASIANWREQRAAAAGTAGAEGEGAGTSTGAAGKRKTSWFAKSGSSSTASPAASTSTSTSTVPTLAAKKSREDLLSSSPASTSALPTPKEEKVEKKEEEVSAKKLREVLQARAESREREREREREERAVKEREEEAAANKEEVLPLNPDPPAADPVAAAKPPLKSNLSLTAPSSAADEVLVGPLELNEPPALPPRTLTESPLPALPAPATSTADDSSAASTKSTISTGSSESTTPTTATGASQQQVQRPALPARPAEEDKLLPAAPAPEPSPSAGSSASSTLAAPPPPPRRPSHTPSASVDSPSLFPSSSPRRSLTPSSSHSALSPPVPSSPTFHSTSSTVSSSPSGLLASWRHRAAPLVNASGEERKEMVAQGVAQAREGLKRWGQGWAAKRAAGGKEDEAGGQEGKKDVDAPAAGEYKPYCAPPSPQTASSSTVGAALSSTPPTPPTASHPIPPSLPPRTPDRPALPPRHGRSSSVSLSTSPGAAGSAFIAPSASSPSAPKVTPASISASPTRQPLPSYGTGTGAGGAAGGYKRASMMAVPGIRDQAKKERVREDHLGGGGGGGAAMAVPSPASSPPTAAGHAKKAEEEEEEEVKSAEQVEAEEKARRDAVEAAGVVVPPALVSSSPGTEAASASAPAGEAPAATEGSTEGKEKAGG